MQIYLPIAEIPVNILVILFLGLAAGFLAGMFSIGGGFISTPLLIFIGIPSSIAVSTSINQIVASSASGLLANLKKGNVDIRMGLFLVVGGFIGSTFGVSLFNVIDNYGHIDIVIAAIYVLFIGGVAVKMLKDSAKILISKKYGIAWNKENKGYLDRLLEKINDLPFKIYFPQSEITVSIIVPVVISIGIGILVTLIGIGGGFLMIPAMIYILRMPAKMIVGTSLFQIVFIASNATFLQAVTNKNVDIVLSLLMIISSAIGAQIGMRSGYKADADKLRLLLSLILLTVCFKMLLVLFAQPSSLYAIEVLKK